MLFWLQGFVLFFKVTLPEQNDATVILAHIKQTLNINASIVFK